MLLLRSVSLSLRARSPRRASLAAGTSSISLGVSRNPDKVNKKTWNANEYSFSQPFYPRESRHRVLESDASGRSPRAEFVRV
jgi:hypothetical protein